MPDAASNATASTEEAPAGRVAPISVAERHSGELAICVLHAGTVGALIEVLCGLPLHEHVALYTGNCGICVVGEAGGAASIVTLNDQRHIPADER